MATSVSLANYTFGKTETEKGGAVKWNDCPTSGDGTRERLHLMGKHNRGAILLQSPLSGEPAYNAW